MQVFPIVAALALVLSSLSTFATAQPSMAPAAGSVCNVCGDPSFSVDPNLNVTFNEDVYPCGELQDFGLAGDVTELECTGAISVVLQYCNCTEADALDPAIPVSAPTPTISPGLSAPSGVDAGGDETTPTTSPGPTTSDAPSASPVDSDENKTTPTTSPGPTMSDAPSASPVGSEEDETTPTSMPLMQPVGDITSSSAVTLMALPLAMLLGMVVVM